MKLVQTKILAGESDPVSLAAFELIRAEIEEAITKVVNPPGSTEFVINPTPKGNGVVPIKRAFIASLESRGWLIERGFDGAVTKKIRGESRIGAIDALRPASGLAGKFAVEWETGNISSSHRAVNKMCLGLLNGTIFGGALVLPSRELYQCLTDRIGSYQELESYFSLWSRIPFPQSSILAIFEVTHDRTDETVPVIPKGKDGNADKEPQIQ
jgi:hypothetical protein